MRASDILAKALEIWGTNGEAWCRGTLRLSKDCVAYTKAGGYHLPKQDAYCLYGGIGMAAQGRPMYEPAIETRDPKNQSLMHEHNKALIYVRMAIAKRMGLSGTNTPINISHYNDNSASFAPVKAVVCDALKDALADEE